VSRSVKLTGLGASGGAALGTAFLVDRRREQEPREHLAPERLEGEVARLNDAIERSDQQLAEISGKLAGQPQEHGLIIEAYRLMVRDPLLVAGAEELIRGEAINAEWAVRRVAKQLRGAFDGVDDPYFRERQNDIDFVADRVVENLLGAWRELAEPPPGAIVVAHELSPADAMVLLSGHRIAGIVTEAGGRTSHTAIVARALEIPAVLGCERILELVAQNDTVAVDGTGGVVVLNPSGSEAEAFRVARERYEAHEREALASRELEARTTDGHKVTLRANIELVEEVPSSVAHGADGVGLYRTEFLYLNRKDLPTEDEHYENYRQLLAAMPGRSVTIRTFDLGGEKGLPGAAREEENPSLGLRAIRYCLAHPELFLAQLRALWRASVHGDLRVMFPLVSGVGELRRAKALFVQARAEVEARGLSVAARVPVGIMVETPAAVEVADLLAREAAFFSIGTNDLIQYALAVDRANLDVGYLYRPMHPAIVRMLRRVIDAGRHAGIGVSVCGEMAGDPAYTLVLLALGADELSMGGTSIPTVKQIVRSTSLDEARLLLEHALAIDSDDAVEAWVRAEMVRRYPDVFESYSAELPDEDEGEPREEFPVT
jgi:phosphotransferase system enzyme I (PtsI)